MPDSPTRRQFLALIAFNATCLLAAAIGAAVTGNGEFAYYLVVMLVLLAAVLLVHRRVGLSVGLLWCLSAWGALHMAGGLMPVPESWPIEGPNRVLYSWWLIPGWLKYDQVIHAYGFAITTWLCWQGLRSALTAQSRDGGSQVRPTPGLMVLCAAGGMGFGALNEVIEFIATLTMESTNVGGYENTGWDLVANLIGCGLAALIIGLGGNARGRH